MFVLFFLILRLTTVVSQHLSSASLTDHSHASIPTSFVRRGAKAPSSAQIRVRLSSSVYSGPLDCEDLTVVFFLSFVCFCFIYNSSCCLRLESQLVSDIQTILQLLQRQTTPGPPAYSTVTSNQDYHRPAMKVQPVPLITSHLFSHGGNQVSNTKEEKWMQPNHCCSIK